MIEVDYTDNNRVTNKPPRVAIIEHVRGKDKRKRKVKRKKNATNKM